MEIVYAKDWEGFEKFLESSQESLFLAGPTPRSEKVPSWRPEALRILEEMNFEGYVFVPEPKDGRWRGDYDDQVEWEARGLELATVISFWIQRKLRLMPARITDVEFGIWMKSGKIVLGAPKNAPKVKYHRYWATKLGIPQAITLEDTLSKALKMIEAKVEAKKI